MSTLNPSPLPDASSLNRGAVSTLAQSFAGIKTFVNAVILSAGLQVTGVLASSTNFLYVMSAAFTGSVSSGNVQARLGGGNNSLAPQATLDLVNSVGKAVALVAGTASTRIVFDDSGPFYLLRTARTNLDSGAPNTGTTAILTVDASGNVSTNTGYLEAQKGLKVTDNIAGDTGYLTKIEATSTGLPTNGITKVHIGHGNRPTQLVSTLGLFNSLGRGMAFAASSGIARLTFDDAGPFYFSTANRTLLEAGDYLSSTTVRFFIDPGTNRVATGIGTSLQTVDANTWNKTQRGAVTVLTSSGGSIAVDLSTTNNFSHTLTENTTLAAPANPVEGQWFTMVFTNHASSPKTLTFNAFWKFAGGVVPTLTAANGAVDVLTGYVASSGFAVCSLTKGYA